MTQFQLKLKMDSEKHATIVFGVTSLMCFVFTVLMAFLNSDKSFLIPLIGAIANMFASGAFFIKYYNTRNKLVAEMI